MTLETQLFLVDVLREVTRERMHRPANGQNLDNLTATNGEIATAMIAVNCDQSSDENVWNKCVRVAAMALRVAVEGNAEWKYNPPHQTEFWVEKSGQ